MNLKNVKRIFSNNCLKNYKRREKPMIISILKNHTPGQDNPGV